MKILYVITGLTIGGAEKVVIDLAEKLSNKGNQIKIVYLKGEPKILPLNKEIEVLGLGLDNPIMLLSSLKKFGRILKSFRPDVVHANMFHANIFSRIVRIFYPIKFLICSLHNSSEKGILRPYIYKLTNFLANVNTNVSEEACLAYKNIFKGHEFFSIYNGIDVERFRYSATSRNDIRSQYDIKADDFLILCVGRLNKQKDYPNLIKAINFLPEKESLKIFIVGEGEEKEHIQSLIFHYKLSSKIKLLGVRSDIPALMSACDVFVLPSAWEGFGLVVAEAMSCEKIVIATNSGGVKEVIGKNNFLINPQDHKSLSDSILEVMNMDSVTKHKFGKLNREFIVNNFSLDSMVENWIKVYKKSGRVNN